MKDIIEFVNQVLDMQEELEMLRDEVTYLRAANAELRGDVVTAGTFVELSADEKLNEYLTLYVSKLQ